MTESEPESALDKEDVARLRVLVRLRRALLRIEPAKLLLFGYLSYMLLGWVLLSLPIALEQPVGAIDTLFIASSAVSTTGLVTLDPGAHFSLFGEIVIALLIQVGSLGYMTIGSFAVLATQDRLTKLRRHAVRSAFQLPDDIQTAPFIRSVVVFTVICELAGAAALYPLMTQAAVDNPLWSAVFHSISAFGTAGFSLFTDSFMGFQTSVAVNVVISVLSLLGAMGFLIVVDLWRTLTGGKQHLGFTSKVIARITLAFLLVGTLMLFVTEPTFAELPPSERLLAAFFQTMTATTTVGFNTYDIGALSLPALIIIMFFMVFGASPAGTGGGLKTTSFAALAGLVRSTLKGRNRVRFWKREVPLARLQTATASLAYYLLVLCVALFLLTLTEAGRRFEVMLFEVISALGTVGLSMGLTSDLSDLGKLIVLVLMTAGRLGILTFGIALAAHDESREEEADNDLVL